MLTVTVEEYLRYRTRNPDLLMFDLWRVVTVTPRWEDTEQVERMMRMKPERGGVLYV